MESKSGKEIIINDVEVSFMTYDLEQDKISITLNWWSNIGFREMTFIKYTTTGEIKVDTEFMSNNEDKEFIRLVLNKLIEKIEVIG